MGQEGEGVDQCPERSIRTRVQIKLWACWAMLLALDCPFQNSKTVTCSTGEAEVLLLYAQKKCVDISPKLSGPGITPFSPKGGGRPHDPWSKMPLGMDTDRAAQQSFPEEHSWG